jgi:type I restriction enzyme M protein
MPDDIAATIRDLRAKLQLSQEELAQRLNVSFATVNRWENGKAQPQGTARDAINKLLDEAGGDQLVLRTIDEIVEADQPRRRKRGTARSAVLSHKSMEQMLWDSACSIRGEKDAPKFKDYILPLIFIKRLSDVFDDEVKRLVETYGDAETALEVLEADHSLVRFYLPPECRWPVVSRREQFKWPKDKTPKTLGEQLTMSVRAIAKANAEKLAGVIDIVDYNAAPHGEREISDQALSGVIETLSDPRYRLGLKDVEPDFLGRAYEYLLRKFAESQGQSAGEFFTPQEVGWLMAYIVRPRQGEDVCDYACGSAGLLIKCELALVQSERKVSRPLKLYGQELTGSSYAIARMNMVIHDMEGEIVRGNSMTNPKFRESDTSLKKFDIVVANPMWNQPFDETIFEKDPFNRFDSQGGTTTGRGDWAWLQHTAALLKETGRAAVVLDTGAVSRGSGKKNEDKEKNIRKWFVEQDLVDGVILLPENLFYNTPADGVIILLRKNKPKGRAGKITLVNASQHFTKGQPKNFIPQESVQKIADAFTEGEDVEDFVKVITTADAASRDFNLSPSLYVSPPSQRTIRAIPDIIQDLDTLARDTQALAGNFDSVRRTLVQWATSPKRQAPQRETPIGPIPAHWDLATIGQKCHKPEYGLTASANAKPVGPKFLRITDITDSGVDWKSVPYCECAVELIEAYRLHENDIVFARIGATTGKSFIVKNPPPAVFASYLIRVRPREGMWPDFLYYFFQSAAYWKQVDANKGNNLKGGVNGSILASMFVPVPPLEEQKQIACALRRIEETLRATESQRTLLSHLLDSIAHNTMTGDLPASALATKNT